MYYLVNIKLIRPNWVNDEFQRLVKATTKNHAHDKTQDYLMGVYISREHPANKDMTFKIEVLDTIE